MTIRLTTKSRECYDAICGVAQANGVSTSLTMGGKHPVVVLSKNGQSRKIFFSTSPSDFRAANNSERDAKRVISDMGWEDPVANLVSTGKGSMFDAQSASHGAASPVVRIAPDTVMGAALQAALEKDAPEIVLHGVPMMHIPDIAKRPYQAGHNGSAYAQAYREFLDRRRGWVEKAVAAGATVLECAEAFAAAGHQIPAAKLSACRPVEAKRTYTRNDRAPPRPVAVKQDRDGPEPDLMAALAAIVEQLIERRTGALLAEIEQLKAKADKWDALRGLVKDD